MNDSEFLQNALNYADNQEIRQLVTTALLFQGIRQHNISLVQMALEERADVNAVSLYEKSRTALHEAASLDFAETVSLLLKHKAKITKDYDGHEPSSLTHDLEIEKILTEEKHHQAATVIQRYALRFLTFKTCKEIKVRKKKLQDECSELKVVDNWFKSGDMDKITELAKAFKEDRLDDAEALIYNEISTNCVNKTLF